MMADCTEAFTSIRYWNDNKGTEKHQSTGAKRVGDTSGKTLEAGKQMNVNRYDRPRRTKPKPAEWGSWKAMQFGSQNPERLENWQYQLPIKKGVKEGLKTAGLGQILIVKESLLLNSSLIQSIWTAPGPPSSRDCRWDAEQGDARHRGGYPWSLKWDSVMIAKTLQMPCSHWCTESFLPGVCVCAC